MMVGTRLRRLVSPPYVARARGITRQKLVGPIYSLPTDTKSRTAMPVMSAMVLDRPVAPQAGVKTETVRYPLAQANEALADLREGRLQGAAVLVP